MRRPILASCQLTVNGPPEMGVAGTAAKFLTCKSAYGATPAPLVASVLTLLFSLVSKNIPINIRRDRDGQIMRSIKSPRKLEASAL